MAQSSNRINTTFSILRHIFAQPNFLAQISLFYTTTALDNATFRSPFCHIEEVVSVKNICLVPLN